MIINGGGAGGTGSDECTARLSDIPAGLKAVTADSNDEAGVGTMTMTGNAQAAHVLAGETFYTNNYKTKLTGTMTVNSLLNFSVAAYSGRRVLAKWQNPNQVAGKPFSGVIIRYSTSGYPGTTGGTQIYKGAGNNTAAGGWSQTYLDMPALNTTYYFSCYPYVTTGGELIGSFINATCQTGANIFVNFTSSTTYTIPVGYTMLDLFAVGGGSGGGGANYNGGGGGGYTQLVTGISVVAGQVLSVNIGAGGVRGLSTGTSGVRTGNPGGASYAFINGNVLINADGGTVVDNEATPPDRNGRNGGSGGGASSNDYISSDGTKNSPSGKNGGADGSNGGSADNGKYYIGGLGQGFTTRAWGNGTLYAGGGGGGATGNNGKITQLGGAGGAGGGGSGGNSGYWESYPGANGGANTGGGGGGAAYNGYRDYKADGGDGGSGIVLAHIY